MLGKSKVAAGAFRKQYIKDQEIWKIIATILYKKVDKDGYEGKLSGKFNVEKFRSVCCWQKLDYYVFYLTAGLYFLTKLMTKYVNM